MSKLASSTRNRVRSTIAFTLVTAYTCQSRTGICASISGISACPTACQKTTRDRQNAESHCDWTNSRHSSTCCQSYMQQIHSWLTRNRVVRTATMQTNSACSTVAHAIRFVVSSCKMALNCDLVEKTVTPLTLWRSSLRDCLWSHVDVRMVMVVCVLIKQNIVFLVYFHLTMYTNTTFKLQFSIFDKQMSVHNNR